MKPLDLKLIQVKRLHLQKAILFLLPLEMILLRENMILSMSPVFHDILLHSKTQHFRQVKQVSLSESVQDLKRLDLRFLLQPTLRDACLGKRFSQFAR